MNKRVILSFLFFLFGLTVVSYAQSPAKYWVQFNDKNGSAFSIERPQEFLSPKAIENRRHFNIPITEQDLPVNRNYINQVLRLDSNMVLFTKSKWLNGITVYSEKENIKESIEKLCCVKFCEKTISLKEPEPLINKIYTYFNDMPPTFSLPDSNGEFSELEYGEAFEQIRVNNIHWLHRMGFKGQGMLMMVMDGGFLNADTLRHFAVMRNEQRIRGAINFVEQDLSPFQKDNHGTMVLSCIASYLPGELIGTAPMVSTYLAKTEDGRSENKVEEDNWVTGIEWADSLGCMVLNSSLGYYKFDDSTQIRKYEDLNGVTSRASVAASIAAAKGLIVCCSAGNEGNDEWGHIVCPSDAKDVLCVGGVDIYGKRAPFSSHGPTYDGRVKPDAAAVGKDIYVATPRSKTIRSNGTSFSSPMLSGMVVCLWQAFPDKTNYEVMDAIRRSGHQATQPDSLLGYGITDFLRAYNYLLQPESPSLKCYFPSFVTAQNQINATISSERPVTVTVETVSRKTKQIVTKIYKIENEKNLVIQLPKCPKKELYDIIDVKISTDNNTLNYVVGIEHLNDKNKK